MECNETELFQEMLNFGFVKEALETFLVKLDLREPFCIVCREKIETGRDELYNALYLNLIGFICDECFEATQGDIEDVKIYDRAITAEEVLELNNQ